MLFNKGKIAFSMNLNEFIDKILSIPGINLIDLSVLILIESTSLPNYEHKDPADRMIISSCRINDAYLMTFDEKIVVYARHGYLKIADINS